MIRNAGGRASDDAIRSLVISYKLLGTKEWFVIHHSDCGMEFFTDDTIRGLLATSLDTAALGADGFYDVGTSPGSSEGQYIDWLTVVGPRASRWSRMFAGSATIRSCPAAFRSTATSTTCARASRRGS